MLLSRKYKWSSRWSNIRYMGNERSIYFGAKFEQPFFFSCNNWIFSVVWWPRSSLKKKKNRAIRARIPTHTCAYVITNFRFNSGTSRFSTVGLSLLKSQHSATFFFFFFCNYHRPRTFHFFPISLRVSYSTYELFSIDKHVHRCFSYFEKKI